MTGQGPFPDVVDRGLDRLLRAQLPSGEIPSMASPLDGSGTPVDGGWVPDTLKFITALAALALDEIPDPRAASIVDRAVTFLRRERETMAQWRYWSSDNDQFDLTPPDADDTACCSLAVATRGDRTTANVPLLLANRDERGRFYTWLIPRGRPLDPRVMWGLRDEVRSLVRTRRDELWSTTEAQPGDVDGVVNANVVRYLGPRRAPSEVVTWLCSIIDEGREADCDAWHRNPYTFYASIADAHRRGVRQLARVGPTIAERIEDAVRAGQPTAALDRSFALLALTEFSGGATPSADLVEQLRATQRDDGSWQRSIFFYGGPDEVFGWASEALSTASVLQSLYRATAR